MPVRSLSSPVLRWPDATTVFQAFSRWAAESAATNPDVLAIGCFGSYARGDWGVGSDIDILIILSHAREPLERRALRFDATRLPVPADLLVYSQEEWNRLAPHGPPGRTRAGEVLWVFRREPAPNRSTRSADLRAPPASGGRQATSAEKRAPHPDP